MLPRPIPFPACAWRLSTTICSVGSLFYPDTDALHLHPVLYPVSPTSSPWPLTGHQLSHLAPYSSKIKLSDFFWFSSSSKNHDRTAPATTVLPLWPSTPTTTTSALLANNCWTLFITAALLSSISVFYFFGRIWNLLSHSWTVVDPLPVVMGLTASLQAHYHSLALSQ